MSAKREIDMGMSDFNSVEREFQAKCKATASKLIALIDKRLAVIRRMVPGAAFGDAMGTSFLYVEGLRDNQKDPLYIAQEFANEEKRPMSAEEWGEPLPPYLVLAEKVYNRHANEILEILKIAEYLYDTVGYTYS